MALTKQPLIMERTPKTTLSQIIYYSAQWYCNQPSHNRCSLVLLTKISLKKF